MGKIQGIVGGISGKMGNAVFRQRDGETIISQYQPIVKNPNTINQQNARAAFKLATQLSAIMAPAIGSMGTINRPARQKTARNGFVARNYNLISTTSDPTTTDKVTATIAMEKVQLTSSEKQFGTISIESAAGSGTVNGTIDGLPSLGSGNISAKVVLIGYEQLENGGSRAYVHSMIDVPKEAGSTHAAFKFAFQDLPLGEKFTVLSYGMIELTTGKSKVDYNNIHTPSDEDFISSVVIDQSLSEGSMEVTNTIGANVTTTAA